LKNKKKERLKHFGRPGFERKGILAGGSMYGTDFKPL
jgi:hypothetical protein